MDTAAARIANVIVGNEESAAVLETHYPACEVAFDEETFFSIAGADFDAKLDGTPVRNWSNAIAASGSVLKFNAMVSGSRSYIGVRGGFNTERWLESNATNLMAGFGGFSGRKLMSGDRIETFDHGSQFPLVSVGVSLLPRYSQFPTVRVVAANEFELLSTTSEMSFLRDGFTLTNDCDRMGYRLSGPPLNLLHEREMISAAVTFGTIQLLPDGQLIVLMADHQTSGGYPRIANVISTDLPLLAQCRPGDGVSFVLISIAEAERLSTQFEKELNYLRVGCRLQKQNEQHRS